MTDQGDRFRTLSSLFDEVVDLEPEAREARIAERCGNDGAMEEELRALLHADDLAGSKTFVGGVVATEAVVLTAGESHGRQLGPWRIVRPLGEGGMGTVYLAERADGEYEARAAIKLVRGGLTSPALTERFRAERQILAGLSHPGIAQMLDGGSTDDGTPYIVMELIEGQPVTEWCDAHDLDVEGRLRLFLEICEAVAYAHANLVAHRDLKPSNILVGVDARPKLLDFGIAKLMQDLGDASDGVTQGYTVLTPAYSSPEQVAGERAGVSTDIYSLGVLLYRLLTDRLPIETRGLTPIQLISTVTQEVPPVASSVIDDPLTRRRVHGDLDAILSRALRKEPEQRYASVDALADDVRLHLEGRPIRTRSDDWRYRTGKLVRRNRGAVSGALLMVLLGISFTVNTVLQARAVARERDRAEAERVTAERVSGFLEELFTEADPNTTSAREITVRDILDRGAERVLTGLAGEPESRAALSTVMGRVYMALGEYTAAEPLLDSALAARRRTAATDLGALGDALLERGALAYNRGEYPAAVRYQTEAVEAYQRAYDPPSREVAEAMGWLAVSHQEAQEPEEAERVMRGAVDLHRRLDGDGSSQGLATAIVTLQDVLRANGKVEEALALGREGLPMVRETYGSDHLETAWALNQLASSLRASDRAAEAIPLVEEGLAIRRAAYDGPHVEIAASLGNLANMLAASGRDAEAIAPRRASVAMLEDVFSEGHPYVAGATASLGAVLLQNDSLDAAETVLVDALRISALVFPDGHQAFGAPLTNLGILYRRTGRLAESRARLEEAYVLRTEALPEGHWYIAATGIELGETLDAMGRIEAAEPYLVEALTIFGQDFGADDGRTARARDALRDHYVRRGMEQEAAELGGSGTDRPAR